MHFLYWYIYIYIYIDHIYIYIYPCHSLPFPVLLHSCRCPISLGSLSSGTVTVCFTASKGTCNWEMSSPRLARSSISSTLWRMIGGWPEDELWMSPIQDREKRVVWGGSGSCLPAIRESQVKKDVDFCVVSWRVPDCIKCPVNSFGDRWRWGGNSQNCSKPDR